MTGATRHSDTWRHVHPTSQHGPKPAPQNTSEFRAQVERDALHCGHTPEFAAWLAREVTKPPKTDDEISAMSPRTRTVLGLRMSTDRRAVRDELADLAALFDAGAVLPALRAAALSLPEATALLRDAANPRTWTVTGSRADALRAQLCSLTYWKNQ